MNKVKYIIISLLAIFISFLIIDEGKTIMLIGNNIQLHLNHNQNNELEIPHLQKLSTTDDEKCMSLKSFELSFSSVNLLLFPCYLDRRTEGYKGLIWQPPKS
jgi:hypothetical protein